MRVLLLSLSLVVLATPLAANTVIVEELIAKVNGDVILRSEYDDFLADLRSEVNRDDRIAPESKADEIAKREKNILRDLIDQRLLVQKGDEVGVNVEAQVLRQRDQIMQQMNITDVDEFEDAIMERYGMPVEDMMQRLRESFTSNAVLGGEVGNRIVVTNAEIEDYFEQNKEEFNRSEGVRLQELLLSTEGMIGKEKEEKEKLAREVHTRVQAGEPFAEMAKRFSDSEATKQIGGDIGIFRRGQLRKDMEDLVFDKNPGYITELIEVPRGFLLLKVVEKYREGLAELDEVREEIRAKLAEPRYPEEVRKFLSELRQQSYIEIRPGYIDSQAVPGKNTAWSDPAKLAPVTTTREEVLGSKKKKLLWMIPIGSKGTKAEKESRKEEKKAEKQAKKDEKKAEKAGDAETD